MADIDIDFSIYDTFIQHIDVLIEDQLKSNRPTDWPIENREEE